MSVHYVPTLEGYSGQGAFRFWCQKVLPLVYDDSLSYYELLCKVVDYLNKAISDIATAETNIDSIYNGYLLLENYVNKYFDNLDVQQEINHKLDAMVISGELTGIIRPIITEEASTIISDWLENNIDPSTVPIIDKSLSVVGAAADAGAVGFAIKGLEGIAPIAFTITGEGAWGQSASRHIEVPVEPGDVISITANDTYEAVCAFLKSGFVTSATPPDFCDNVGTTNWHERKVIPVSSTATYTAPSDCYVLYLSYSNPYAPDLMPKKVTINGVDIIGDLRELIDELTDRVDDVDNSIYTMQKNDDLFDSEIFRIKKNLDINQIRKTFKGEYTKITLPNWDYLKEVDSLTTDKPYEIQIVSDSYDYIRGVDLRELKNDSTNTVTVHNQSELVYAINGATPGDTIILDGGLYTPIVVRKSINLIGKNNPIFTNEILDGFVVTGVKYVYRIDSYTGDPDMLLDITGLNEGVIVPLTNAGAVSNVVNTPASYCISSGSLYVHLLANNKPNSRNVVSLRANNGTSHENLIKFDGSNSACRWYMENITFFGGHSCVYAGNSVTYPKQKLIGVNCKGYYAQGYNIYSLVGVDGYYQNCLAAYGYLDGFSYHENDDVTNGVSNGVELDCISHDNGKREPDGPDPHTNNGSTMHDGGKMLRLNGVYYNNNGANVADANSDTISYNYGCLAYDSVADYNNTQNTSADYWVRGSGTNLNAATMYLYGCKSVGNSQYSLIAFNNATIYKDSGTEYDQTKASGNISNI